MEAAPPPARVLRALTSDRHIRLSAMDARSLWDGVRRGHPHLCPEACALLVELLTAAALLQSRSLLAERLQLVLRSSGRARSIVADSWPDGSLRGILDTMPVPGSKLRVARQKTSPATDQRLALPALEAGTENGISSEVAGIAGDADISAGLWIAPPGNFQVMRSNPGGPPYIGNLELIDGPISAQTEHYLQQSEQVQACVALWCDPDTGDACGLIVEPLPGCPPKRIKAMLDALDGLEVTQAWERTPEFLAEWINQGGRPEILSSLALEYRCRCSRQSLIDTLGAMPKQELEEIFSGGPAEVCCDYCGHSYSIALQELEEGVKFDGAER